MKIHTLSLVLIAIAIFSFSCNNKNASSESENSEIIYSSSDSLKRVSIGEAFSKEQLKRFLNDSTENLIRGEVLLNDKQSLIQLAEPILFRIYGKEDIVEERPYEIYLIGDYWIMSGTLPRDMLGGTFSIAVNRKTCEVIGITHGK
jgi:hypothetical protein